ncbi:hypothetical protein GCM10023084_18540 [Streptomyces lacrimifluminis]|uniref:Uncharacterized protein n=1 Tax=Streptomyces lacrimifluminis TaxID=1500077 RepID=A0A917KEW5_9ACTN|nr:hypothetical protein GCM10012282_02910 [Streptomyces lacrimifluminis]
MLCDGSRAGAGAGTEGARRAGATRPGESRPNGTRELTLALTSRDKAGNWSSWYDTNIPIAEKRYQQHIAELHTREYE